MPHQAFNIVTENFANWLGHIDLQLFKLQRSETTTKNHNMDDWDDEEEGSEKCFRNDPFTTLSDAIDCMEAHSVNIMKISLDINHTGHGNL